MVDPFEFLAEVALRDEPGKANLGFTWYLIDKYMGATNVSKTKLHQLSELNRTYEITFRYKVRQSSEDRQVIVEAVDASHALVTLLTDPGYGIKHLTDVKIREVTPDLTEEEELYDL